MVPINVVNEDHESLGNGFASLGADQPLARPYRSQHDDTHAEPELCVPDYGARLRNAKQFHKPEGFTESANRGTRFVVSENRDDRLHQCVRNNAS
jgi:hypothetical protein